MAPCYEDCFSAENPDLFHSAFDFELSSDLVASLGELFDPASLLPDSALAFLPPSSVPLHHHQQQLQPSFLSQLALPDARFPTLAQGIAAAAACIPAASSSAAFLMPPSPSVFLSPASSPSTALPTSPSSFSSPFASAYSSPSFSLSPDISFASETLPREPRAQCDTLPGKRVSFKLSPSDAPEILSLKEFYARVAEPELLKSLILSGHPFFPTQDDAVGHFYVLKDVRARKPPQIGNDKFNCHTRRDAGDSHWQYNVPGTDFTCRVTQWVGTDDASPMPRLATYTSYHYYRSPSRRAVRWSPY